MPSEPHQPSRIPVRGSLALVGTVGALALLLSFRSPQSPPGHVAVAASEPTPPATESSQSATEVAAPEPVTLTGDAYSFRFGSVQVAVTLQGADIVDVVAIALPDDDRHSARISHEVEPILREEAIASDSADVSVISGATYTSRAYAASLQSALDQAG